MAIAGGTVPCMYFNLKNGRLSENNGRALRELVYKDLDAALAKLLSGAPVYVEAYGDNIPRFRTMASEHLGELRFK